MSTHKTLTAAPVPDLAETDTVARRDRHRNREALSIIPVVEGGEPVPACVGRREGQGSGGSSTPPHWSNLEVLPDAEWTARELHEERDQRVDVPIPIALKAEAGKGTVKDFRWRRSRQHEVHIDRLVRATRVEAGAGPAGENTADSSAPQGIADRHGNLRERRFRAQLHSGLPARRGLRRRVPARSRSPPSGSRSRSRYRPSSLRAKARGLRLYTRVRPTGRPATRPSFSSDFSAFCTLERWSPRNRASSRG